MKLPNVLRVVLSSPQLYIALFGVAAVLCTQLPYPELRKWAGILGLVGQPFWFYSSYKSKQWGIFFLCFLYTGSWAYGVYLHWF